MQGKTEIALADYTREIVGSGFPGLGHLTGRPLHALLDGYLSRIVDTDFIELGQAVRRPHVFWKGIDALSGLSYLCV